MKHLLFNLFKKDKGKFCISESWWLGLTYNWRKLIYINVEDYKKNGINYSLNSSDYNWQYVITSDPDLTYFKENEKVINEMIKFECYTVYDLSPLLAFKHIKELSINLCDSDIEVNSGKQDLEDVSIFLQNNKKINLEPISYIQDLEDFSIFIQNNTKVNLEPISKLKKLKKVFLFLDYASIDLNPLSKLKNITHLSICYNSSRLDPLSKLKNLTYLYISNNRGDLSALSKLTRLKELSISENSANLEPLSKLINLTSLELKYNKADLTPINELKNLTFLNLYPRKCKINTISELISQTKRNKGTVFLYENGDSPF